MNMNTTDNLIFAEDARKGIMEGVKKCAKAVGITMGTSGQNSIIKTFERPGFLLTNDGATILSRIKLADPLEETGREFLMEAVSNANKSSGDGSSTTCVLTAAILEEGVTRLKDTSAMEIKRSLEACIPLIEKSLDDQARGIGVDEVWKVASISAEDEEIGRRIGEIYQKIGTDGIIQWEAAKVPEDSYTIGVGIQIQDAGSVSPYLNDINAATGQVLSEARMKDVPVIMMYEKIGNPQGFNAIFQSLYDRGDRDCVIFCNEVSPEVVGSFIGTRSHRGFRVCLVKMPTIFGNEWWEDIAIASGAKIISKDTGLNLLDITLEDVGRLGNVLVRKDSVYMDGIRPLTQHIADLIADGEDASRIRAARLNTKTARYFVGGHSESAISYRRLKVEDAINAASEALEGGVVAGGGVALRMAGFSLGEDSIGSKILSKVLSVPMLTICNNAGYGEKMNSVVGDSIGINRWIRVLSHGGG